MVEVPVNIRFVFKKQAIDYAKCEVANSIRPCSYLIKRGRYWSMDIMDYVPSWVVVMKY